MTLPRSPRTTPEGDKVWTFRNTKFLFFVFVIGFSKAVIYFNKTFKSTFSLVLNLDIFNLYFQFATQSASVMVCPKCNQKLRQRDGRGNSSSSYCLGVFEIENFPSALAAATILIIESSFNWNEWSFINGNKNKHFIELRPDLLGRLIIIFMQLH